MLSELLASFAGQLSLAVIGFVVVMAVYFIIKFIKLSAPENKSKE